MTTFSRNACPRPPRRRFGAVINIHVATICASASETKTATPLWSSVRRQIISACSGGNTSELTSDTRKRSSKGSKSAIVAGRAIDMVEVGLVRIADRSYPIRMYSDEADSMGWLGLSQPKCLRASATYPHSPIQCEWLSELHP